MIFRQNVNFFSDEIEFCCCMCTFSDQNLVTKSFIAACVLLKTQYDVLVATKFLPYNSFSDKNYMIQRQKCSSLRSFFVVRRLTFFLLNFVNFLVLRWCIYLSNEHFVMEVFSMATCVFSLYIVQIYIYVFEVQSVFFFYAQVCHEFFI